MINTDLKSQIQNLHVFKFLGCVFFFFTFTERLFCYPGFEGLVGYLVLLFFIFLFVFGVAKETYGKKVETETLKTYFY